MDSDRFDDLSRTLAKPKSRRTALAALAALAGLGALAPHKLDAKKKKKKKKEKKPTCTSPCLASGEICRSTCDCCAEMICDPQIDVDGLCCLTSGKSCGFSAECCGDLTCRPIGGGGTCQPCRTAGQSCTDVSECCASIQSCTGGFCVA